MVDISKDEMEKLQKLRTELESRLAAIEEEQKAVEEETRILREKAAIRELERKVREKQEELANLRIEKKELEDKLKAPNKLSISEAIQKTKAEIESKKELLETRKEEQPRIIWKKDEQTSESGKTPEAERKEPVEEKKRKLKFF